MHLHILLEQRRRLQERYQGLPDYYWKALDRAFIAWQHRGALLLLVLEPRAGVVRAALSGALAIASAWSSATPRRPFRIKRR